VPGPLIARVRQVWAALAGVPVRSFSVSVPRAVASPDSKICPPGWVGIVAITDAVLITAASPAVVQQLDRALGGLALDEVTDVSALSALLPIVEVRGPAWLSYLGQEDLPVRHGDQAVERLSPGHGDLMRLRGAVSQDEANESGLADITSDAFVVRQAGEIVSAAGFRRWPDDVAHLSVLTAAPSRGQGLATSTACAAVDEALAQHLLPQWRARLASSHRVSARLGFQELGRQLSLKLDDTPPEAEALTNITCGAQDSLAQVDQSVR
jgi:hypothetical protein